LLQDLKKKKKKEWASYRSLHCGKTNEKYKKFKMIGTLVSAPNSEPIREPPPSQSKKEKRKERKNGQVLSRIPRS
jgi:hypothetical protein